MTLAQGPPPAGDEFQVNTYTTGPQFGGSVAVAPEGCFVVVWAQYDPLGFEGEAIFGQRFSADGDPLGAEFQVNTEITEEQYGGDVATGPNGEFVVVWSSYSDGSYTGVVGQRFDDNGKPVGGEFQVNTDTTSYEFRPQVATDGQGGFVVVWTSSPGNGPGGHDGSRDGVFGQRYDASGNPLGGEFQVNTYILDDQSSPDVAADVAGDFVVVWSSDSQDGDGYGTFGQRYDPSGNPQGPEFQVNTTTVGSQSGAAVAMDPAGGFLVAWTSAGDGDGSGIFAQRYDPDGNRAGVEFLVNTYTPSHQWRSRVAADGTGNFIVVWMSHGPDGPDSGVLGQRLDNAGRRVGGEFQVNTYTTAHQSVPSVAVAPTGDLVVIWNSYGQDGSDWGLFGQRYDTGLFADGFESGDTGAWNEVVED